MPTNPTPPPPIPGNGPTINGSPWLIEDEQPQQAGEPA